MLQQHIQQGLHACAGGRAVQRRQRCAGPTLHATSDGAHMVGCQPDAYGLIRVGTELLV